MSDSDSEGRAFESRQAYHVGTDFAPFRFFYAEKSVTRAVVPPFSQKGTLGSPVRLQARSLTAHCRYHLFARAPAAQISQWFGFPITILSELFMFAIAVKELLKKPQPDKEVLVKKPFLKLILRKQAAAYGKLRLPVFLSKS